MSGARYPTTFHGHTIIPMQGTSLTPAFHGAPIIRGKPIFWEHEGNRAVRDGRWKLVARFKQPWQLFDMAESRAETHDLASAHPDLVRKMADQWDRGRRPATSIRGAMPMTSGSRAAASARIGG